MTYSSLFKCKRIHTYQLQNTDTLQRLFEEGFVWVRRYNEVAFHEITRNPTLGCIVEVFTVRHIGCIAINSKEGKKLIKKLCYF